MYSLLAKTTRRTITSTPASAFASASTPASASAGATRNCKPVNFKNLSQVRKQVVAVVPKKNLGGISMTRGIVNIASSPSPSVNAKLESGASAGLLGKKQQQLSHASSRPFSSASASSAEATTGSDASTFLDTNEVTDRVINVLKSYEKVDPSKVTPESHFTNDLGLDSLDTVEVVMAFEEEFVIEIPDDQAEKMVTCQDAIKFIASHPQAR